jgi:hypothetical protein
VGKVPDIFHLERPVLATGALALRPLTYHDSQQVTALANRNLNHEILRDPLKVDSRPTVSVVSEKNLIFNPAGVSTSIRGEMVACGTATSRRE